MIDTHCHLSHRRLLSQLDAVLARAREAGVRAMICATGDLSESEAALDLANRERDVYCMCGIQPHDAKSAPQGYLDRLRNLAAEARNVAIGEIGLDYHYDYSPREDQRRVFAEQLDLAARIGKKTIVHMREAFDETLEILRESSLPPENVVFHSWTSGPDHVRLALDLGATISFSGIVTFKNADDVRDSARLVPPDRLLIETDSPFLSPVPVRKMHTNEPANVLHVGNFLSDLLGISPEQLAEQTTANAVRLFGLDI